MALLKRREPALITTASPPRGSRFTHAQRDRNGAYTGRVVVSSAAPVNINDRNEIARLGRYRQSWQEEAWTYRRALGELKYAVKYLGNSCMRLRLYVGTYVEGSQVPVELTATERHGLPADLVDAAIQVLVNLSGNNPVGALQLQKSLTENFQVAGECYLVGEQLPQTTMGVPSYEWRVRSISEVITKNGQLLLRESPGSSATRPIDTTRTKISRLWTPDPQWYQLADSPFGGILDLAEELLLLGRDVRATVRSRLATNGLLLVPDDLSITGATPEGDDDEDDPFFAGLIAAATAAISNEGDAGAAVPIVVRGPSDSLSKIQHVKIDRPQNKFNVEQRRELIERIATGIDLPAEVLTGKIDLNHWSAWQVDDDTFRHHIEPTAIEEVGSLTIGYLWRELDAMQRWDPEVVRKILVWYDPTELVTHPDRTQDAFQLWDRFAIKDDAMRRVAGFSETDAPDDDEILQRILLRMRSLDPQLQAQILHKIDPAIEIPDTGVEPEGRDTPVNPPEPAPLPGPPAQDAAAARRAEAAQIVSRRLQMRARLALVASAAPERKPDLALSRALVDVDRRLRERVHAAANTSIRRALERAGARLATKMRGASGVTFREMVKDVPVGLIPGTLGVRGIQALGLTEQQILEEEYEDMRRQWAQWVEDAQNQALRDATRAAGLDFEVVARSISQVFASDREEGWRFLHDAMRAAASNLVRKLDEYGPELDLATSDLIMVGSVRAAVALAGGYGNDGQSLGVTAEGFPVDASEPMGQIGTGDTVMGVLTNSGYGRDGYEWVWGGSMNAFAPHLSLNGTRYQRWDDTTLRSADPSFPANGQYYPGDHSGCSCDFMPILLPTA